MANCPSLDGGRSQCLDVIFSPARRARSVTNQSRNAAMPQIGIQADRLSERRKVTRLAAKVAA
jgi:hypothetical protein